jgi:hypothetical protein
VASTGFVPLWAINLTFGMTAITSAQISQHPSAAFLAGLENSHHGGGAGQAPQIKLTSEVQGVLPLPNLPVSNTSPPAVGGSISLSGLIPVEEQGTVNPNGNVAGNAGDMYLQTNSGTLFLCTSTGTSTTAVWLAIGGAPSTIYNNTFPYTVSNTFAYYRNDLSAAGGNGVFNLPTIISNMAADLTIGKMDSSTNELIITPGGGNTVNGVSTYVLAQQNQTVRIKPGLGASGTGTNWDIV